MTQTLTYGYDKLYRLTSAGTASATTAYTYDPLGNRLSQVRAGVTIPSTYDRADRMTSGGVSVNANGNLTNPRTSNTPTTLAYDQANRLAGWTQSTSTDFPTTTTSYLIKYDGDGKRVAVQRSTTCTPTCHPNPATLHTYVYDANAALPVLLVDERGKYVYGLGPAYTVSGAGNGTPLVYHTDGLGSVRALSDATGTVVQTKQTDEFGVVTQTQGTANQAFGYTANWKTMTLSSDSSTCAHGYTCPPSGASCSATLWPRPAPRHCC